MTQALGTEHPPDICLMLRVHGEQYWLVSKVIPAVGLLESPGALEADDLGVALAYLEVLWLEAGLRAAETDAAADRLRVESAAGRGYLATRAERYLAAVRRLRRAVDRRVRALTAPAPEIAGEASGI